MNQGWELHRPSKLQIFSLLHNFNFDFVSVSFVEFCWRHACPHLKGRICFICRLLVSVCVIQMINYSHAKIPHRTIPDTLQGNIPTVVVLVIAVFGFFSVSGLTVFHMYLVSISQTTSEMLQRVYQDRRNPHDQVVFVCSVAASHRCILIRNFSNAPRAVLEICA